MSNSLRTCRRTPAEEVPRVRCPKRDGTLALLDSSGWHRLRLPVPVDRIELALAVNGRATLCSAAVVWTPAGYGPRSWLVCPGCRSRRLDLFIAPGRFACRECLGLTYWSRSRHSRHVDAARRVPSAVLLSPRGLSHLLEARVAADPLLRRLRRERPDVFPLVLAGVMSEAEGMERAGYRRYGPRGWRRIGPAGSLPAS